MNIPIARACHIVVVLSAGMFGCSERAQPDAGSDAIRAEVDASSAGSAGVAAAPAGAPAPRAGTSASTGSGAGSNAGGSAAGSGGSDTAEAGGGGDGDGLAGGDAAGEPPEPRDAAAGSAGATSADEPPVSQEPLRPDQKSVAPETADARALATLANRAAIPVFTRNRFVEQSSHDRGQPNIDEENLTPLLAYDNRDMNNFICKSDDAQIGGARVLAYNFDQERCAESYVHGVVLARFEGSGSLSRFWMTASSLLLSNGVLDAELFRVYVDDDPRPRIQLPLSDVLAGSGGEIFAPPFGAASRACIAWYYPVVFGSKLIIALDRLSSDYYFQADAVLDAEPTQRVAPRQRLAERDRALAELKDLPPNAMQSGTLRTESVSLAAAESRSVQLTGPGTIHEVRLRVAKSDLARLASVQLAVRWDGASEPAIALPLLDLFAASRRVVERGNRTLTAATEGDAQILSLRLPMPFRASAEWKLENTGASAVAFQVDWFGDTMVPSADFGHLHVQRSEATIPSMQLERTVAQASGRGRYVGLCADLSGHQDPALVATLIAAPLNLLEGDLRGMADGQPVLNGTGTEDYPDNAFYFLDSPKATPFAQNWGVVDDVLSRPPGQVSFCRWQVLGTEVDFQSSFTATMEIAQHDPAIVDLHRTVAFLYLQ